MTNKKQDILGEHYLLPLLIGALFILLIVVLYLLNLYISTDISSLHLGDENIISAREEHYKSLLTYNSYLFKNILICFLLLISGGVLIYKKWKLGYISFLVCFIIFTTILFI